MNNLLPDITTLKPITGDWKTFSDCTYNKDWEEMTFENKLQLVNDIVRQTMLYEEFPNPRNEVEDLIGDSYTAALVSLEYLKENNIGTNFRLALARKKIYEKEDALSTHIILLIDDYFNNTYYFDATPNIGYGNGKVSNLNKQKYYEDIIELDYEAIEIINKIRNYSYKFKNNIITKNELIELKKLLKEFETVFIFKGYVEKTNNLLNGKNSNSQLEIDIWNHTVKEWKKELENLINSDINYKRQLEIAQAITEELLKLNPSLMQYANINNNYYPITYLSPRFFYENNLNLVLIKPSSYKLGIQATVREKFLVHGIGATGEIITNMGEKSELFGLKRMHIFHPHGYKYERSMNGPNKIFLIHKTPFETAKIKKGIRNDYGNNIKNKEVIWYDNKPILWDPIITNLVHSTDDASEASMHYSSFAPEFQVMTRFMYPNPKLIKRCKYEK